MVMPVDVAAAVASRQFRDRPSHGRALVRLIRTRLLRLVLGDFGPGCGSDRLALCTITSLGLKLISEKILKIFKITLLRHKRITKQFFARGSTLW